MSLRLFEMLRNFYAHSWGMRLARLHYRLIVPFYRLGRRFRDWRYRRIWVTPLPWGGVILTWPDLMGELFRRGDFESAERAFLMRAVQPGMQVLDIGANIGYFSLLLSKCVGLSGRVISFEPSFRECRRLRANLLLNLRFNVKVVPVALGDCQGEAILHVVSGYNTGCNSLRPISGGHATRDEVIRIETLDQYVESQGLDRLDLIKIDVEGAEGLVFRGGENTLRRFRPTILAEMEDCRCAPFGYATKDVYDHLVGLGYRWFSILPDGSLVPRERTETFCENLVALSHEDEIARLSVAETLHC